MWLVVAALGLLIDAPVVFGQEGTTAKPETIEPFRKNHNQDKKDTKDIAVIVIATVLALLLLIGVMVYVVHLHRKKTLADELILIENAALETIDDDPDADDEVVFASSSYVPFKDTA